MAGQFRRAGLARQGCAVIADLGGVRAPYEGRAGKEAGEGRGEEEDSRPFFFHACPDTTSLSSSGGC